MFRYRPSGPRQALLDGVPITCSICDSPQGLGDFISNLVILPCVRGLASSIGKTMILNASVGKVQKFTVESDNGAYLLKKVCVPQQ